MLEQLIALDHHLFFLINGAHSPAADLFFRLFTHLGTGYVVVPLLVLLLFLKAARQPRRHAAILCIVAATGSACVTSGLKSWVGRSRPPLRFSIMARKETPTVRVVGPVLRRRSFPSGHTNTAFSAAMLCLFLFGMRWGWTFLVAGIVGYSRIYLGVHFPLDVIAGALLGVICTGGLLWAGNRLMRRPLHTSPSAFQPNSGPGGTP